MWPWELYEMLNLAAAVERARDFDIIHYEAAYYPMSLAFTRLSPTPIVQTLHHSPSEAEVALWSRYPGGAVRRDLERAGAAARRAERRRHRAPRHRHRPLRVSRDAGRLPAVSRPLHRGQGRAAGDRDREARRHAADSRGRRGELLPREGRAARRRQPHRLLRRSRLHGEGRSCTAARARCSIRFRRASRSASCSPKRWRAARRWPRSIAARCARSSTTASPVSSSTTSTRWSTGLPRVFGLDRRRVRRRAVARFGVDRMVDEYVEVYRRVVDERTVARRGAADDTIASGSRPRGPDGPRRLRASRRRVAGLRRHAGPARRRGRARRAAVRVARRARVGRAVRCATTSSATSARAELRDAAAALGVAELIVLDHPDGDLRWAHVTEFHAEIVMTHPALPARRRHHVRRGRPVLARRPHRRPRAHDDGRAFARRRGAAALLRHDAERRHARDRRRRARPRAGRRRRRASGASCPTRSGCTPSRRPSSSTSRDWVPRKLAALRCHRSQMGAGQPVSRGSTRRGAALLGVEQFRRAHVRHRRTPVLEVFGQMPRVARAVIESPCTSARSTSCGARTAADGSNWSRRCSTVATATRSRTAFSAATAASSRSSTAFPCCTCCRQASRRASTSKPGGPISRCGPWSVSRTTQRAARSNAAIRSETSTYREIVEALGPSFEGGYFLYRFSDPTYIVAHAVVRAVAGTVLHGARRAVDVCGGSGHLTRSLMDLSSPPPVLADLYFAKVWLARRFTAPGCEPVCCDGNAPLPFARGAFGFAMCSDAFQYIWTKRQFVGEMARLVEAEAERTRAPSSSATRTTSCTWSPSHGQPLSPDGLSRSVRDDRAAALRRSPRCSPTSSAAARSTCRAAIRRERSTRIPALTIVATRHPGVFRPHALDAPRGSRRGEFRLNPLYEVRRERRPSRPAPAFPVRGLRGRVRRVPPVPARGGRLERRGPRGPSGWRPPCRASSPSSSGAGASSSTCRSGTWLSIDALRYTTRSRLRRST